MLVWFIITCILSWRHGSAISYKEKKFSSTLTSNCCICQQYENTNQPTNQIKDDKKKRALSLGKNFRGTQHQRPARWPLFSRLNYTSWSSTWDSGDRFSPWPNFRQKPRSLRFDKCWHQLAKPSCTRILLSQFTENPPRYLVTVQVPPLPSLMYESVGCL